MKQTKWIFLFFALIAAACMMGIGVAIAERSILGIILSIIGVITVFGFGFSLKSKLLKDQ